MDAPEEDTDIKLQKISGDLIADFDRSLTALLTRPPRARDHQQRQQHRQQQQQQRHKKNRRGGGHSELSLVDPGQNDGVSSAATAGSAGQQEPWTTHQDGQRFRSRVRIRETARMTESLLGPFQDLPQLLDPHLPRWLPLLAEAFLAYHQHRHRRRAAGHAGHLRRQEAAAAARPGIAHRTSTGFATATDEAAAYADGGGGGGTVHADNEPGLLAVSSPAPPPPQPVAHAKFLMPLSAAICRILYTFCKIRGEKVIVRFVPSEAKYLELLLSALEEAEKEDIGGGGGDAGGGRRSERRAIAIAPGDASAAAAQGIGVTTMEDPPPSPWTRPEQTWTWEERYIVLLWLSHLMLVPFDLATISSVDVDVDDNDDAASADADDADTDNGAAGDGGGQGSSLGKKRDKNRRLPSIPGFEWPAGLPGITVHVLPLANKYIATPGRERDAAKTLLVRVGMRRDMQQLGVLDALVAWALAALRSSRVASAGGRQTGGVSERPPPQDAPYYYIGVLSFLAGILTSSSDTSDMDPYLETIFWAVHGAVSGTDGRGGDGEEGDHGAPAPSVITSSAVARKAAVKVLRAVVILVVRNNNINNNRNDGSGGGDGGRLDMASTELVETAIGFLLESVADKDTPVRLAASKALSVITLRLDPDMGRDVVDATLEGLNRNVVWARAPAAAGDRDHRHRHALSSRARDVSAVDPLEWHGLMLTLAHLLYRRSPPAASLAGIVEALLGGLQFEKRTASGGSGAGASVRDAACFGVWALARRYSSVELLAVGESEASSATTPADHDAATAITSKNTATTTTIIATTTTATATTTTELQTIATELIATACLDPAGNIRRGASAALQELVGRHPDTVERGIGAVQAVDYHAVALRSRAACAVALGATRLAPRYGEALLHALLRWRGVGDADATARRVAGRSFGAITSELAMAAVRTAEKSVSGPEPGEDDKGGSGSSVGRGVAAAAVERLVSSMELVQSRLKALQTRQVEERHGLLLCLAAVLDALPRAARAAVEEGRQQRQRQDPAGLVALVRAAMDMVTSVLGDCASHKTYRRPDLIAEAGSRLVVSAFPLLQLAAALGSPSSPPSLEGGAPAVLDAPGLARIRLCSGPDLVSRHGIDTFSAVLAALGRNMTAATAPAAAADNESAAARVPGHHIHDHFSFVLATHRLVGLIRTNVGLWLPRQEPEVVAAGSEAALVLLVLLGAREREQTVRGWADVVRRRRPALSIAPSRAGSNMVGGAGGSAGGGYLCALAMAYRTVATAHIHERTTVTQSDEKEEEEGEAAGRVRELICGAFLGRWAEDKDVEGRAAMVESRVAMLESLAGGARRNAKGSNSEDTGGDGNSGRGNIDTGDSSKDALLKQNISRFLGLVAEGLDDYTTTARGDIGSHVRLRALRAARTLLESVLAGDDDSNDNGNGNDKGQQQQSDRIVSVLFPRVLRLAAEKLDRVRAEAQGALATTLRPAHAAALSSSRLTFSSRAYFAFLLELLAPRRARERLRGRVARAAALATDTAMTTARCWADALMAGYVSSADTGNEELVVASRAALCGFCDGGGGGGGAGGVDGGSRARGGQEAEEGEKEEREEDGVKTRRWLVCGALAHNLRATPGGPPLQDRVVVPTLEVIGFLLRMGLFSLPPPPLGVGPLVRGAVGATTPTHGDGGDDVGGGPAKEKWCGYKTLCQRAQRACFKTGSVRKIEACVRMYGAIAAPDTWPSSHGGGGGIGTKQSHGHDGSTVEADVAEGTATRAACADQCSSQADRDAREEGRLEARRRLGALMLHPWPRVRTTVADELWGVVMLSGGERDGGGGGVSVGGTEGEAGGQATAARQPGALTGVDWGRATKGEIKRLVETLRLE